MKRKRRPKRLDWHLRMKSEVNSTDVDIEIPETLEEALGVIDKEKPGTN